MISEVGAVVVRGAVVAFLFCLEEGKKDNDVGGGTEVEGPLEL